MKMRFSIALVSLSLAALPAFGQDAPTAPAGRGGPGGRGGAGGRGGGAPAAPAKPSKPTPRLASGKPDLNGLFQRPYVPNMTATSPRGDQKSSVKELPFTEWGKKQWESYDVNNLVKSGDYTGACLPFGLMRSINSPDPIQFMMTDDYFALLFEQNSWFKVIDLHKKGHDPKAIPTWFGDSYAFWDGDTLVIDTNNFNGRTRLDTNGHPHSNQLHLIERYTRTDFDHITYEVTVDDPKTYTAKWTNTRIFTLRPDWAIIEYSCEENNKGLWEGRITVPKFDDEN